MLNNTRFKGTILAFALTAFALVQGQGNPTDPPPWWWANDGNTTGLYWTFDTPDDPFEYNNPFGDPEILIIDGVGWNNGTVGVDHSSGFFGIQIPNDPRPDWVKLTWLQFDVFLEADPGGEVGIGWTIEVDNAVIEEVAPFSVVDLGGGWLRITHEHIIRPQPELERLFFDFFGDEGKVYMDNLYFGTHCVVPEPATMAALGLGALAMLRRRRK